MAYPRQKLYDTNYFGYVKALIGGKLNDGKIPDFADKFEKLTGLPGALPLSRGRLGIYFGVKQFVNGEKNGVIMSPFTIFDAINMVICSGGKPVFCDSEDDTSPHLHPDDIKKLIDSNTAAVIVTHYHTVNPYIKEIAELCKEEGIALIEDCAISLGSSMDGTHVGGFGDVGVYSFGLFKFISTFFGGAVRFTNPDHKKTVEAEMAQWPKMVEKDLRSYFLKGMKLKLLTQKWVFRFLTFPLFRFGYLYDVELIKNQAKNDPNPFIRNDFPDYLKRRPSDFQVREFVRQFPSIAINKAVRQQNAKVYREALKNVEGIDIPQKIEAWDAYLNFPIYIRGDREKTVKEIMRSGFDVGIYFYRNCAELACFDTYGKTLPHLENYVNHLVMLPTYPDVPGEYAGELAQRVQLIVEEDKGISE